MAKSVVKQAKLRALRPKEDEVPGPGFVVEYEHDDGAMLIIAVNPSRGSKGQILITRMQPAVWEPDGNSISNEMLDPQVSITWKHDEDVCGGYESERPSVVHPTVTDSGTVMERIICLDLDEEPWLEDEDIWSRAPKEEE